MIYFIQAGAKGPIKIGYTSNNIEQRMNDLQCASHKQLYLLGIMDGEMVDEKVLHEQFNEYKIRGEWFSPAMKIRAYIFKNTSNSELLDEEELEYNIEHGFDLDMLLSNIEEKYIRKAMTISGNKKQDAAKTLGLSLRTLRYRCLKYHI